MSSPDGTADPTVVATLAAAAATGSSVDRARALAALSGATVYLAVSAHALDTGTEPGTGLTAERATEMRLASLQASDGARALPVFTDLTALRTWRPDLRPRPVTMAAACAAAAESDHGHVVVDVACDHRLVLGPAERDALAEGLVPADEAARLAGRSVRPSGAQLVAPPPSSGALTAALPELARVLADEQVTAGWLVALAAASTTPVLAVRTSPGADPARLADRLLPILAEHQVDGLDLLPLVDDAAAAAVGLAVHPMPPPRRHGRRRRRLLRREL